MFRGRVEVTVLGLVREALLESPVPNGVLAGRSRGRFLRCLCRGAVLVAAPGPVLRPEVEPQLLEQLQSPRHLHPRPGMPTGLLLGELAPDEPAVIVPHSGRPRSEVVEITMRPVVVVRRDGQVAVSLEVQPAGAEPLVGELGHRAAWLRRLLAALNGRSAVQAGPAPPSSSRLGFRLGFGGPGQPLPFYWAQRVVLVVVVGWLVFFLVLPRLSRPHVRLGLSSSRLFPFSFGRPFWAVLAPFLVAFGRLVLLSFVPLAHIGGWLPIGLVVVN
mmetsp:Transcript_34767/g.83141  ORF Transcript_34767/g.83141 Transcript_34767/m.83141 type:complete len:273 (+) Transcript_34767:1219-2037(+)